MKDIIKEVLLQEAKKKKADDRCTRIAKRKYDVWPSAYASGAVVKCRQGKIWKNESADEELYLGDFIFEDEGYVIDEKWSKDYKKSISYDMEKDKTEKIELPVSDVLQFILKDGTKISVRPSGTEPKIKFYVSTKGDLLSAIEFEKI